MEEYEGGTITTTNTRKLGQITCTTCGCYTYQRYGLPWYDKSGAVIHLAGKSRDESVHTPRMDADAKNRGEGDTGGDE